MKSVMRVRFVALAFVVLALCASACDALPGTAKPVVVIVSPPSGSQYKEGDDIAVQSTSSDAIGVVRVELSVDGAVVLIYAAPSAAPTVPVAQTWKATPGSHTITVRAYNAAGAASDPVAISIQVNSSVALNGPTPVGPTPVGPTPVGPTPVGPTPVGPTPVGPTPVGPTPVGPTPVGPTPVGPTPVGPTPVGPTPVGPTPPGGAPPTATPTRSGPPPIRTPTAAPAARSVMRFHNQILVAPTQSGQVQADCPSGYQVMDGGFNADSKSFVVYQNAKQGNSWQVAAMNDTDSGGGRDLVAFVVCGKNLAGTVSQLTQSVKIAGVAGKRAPAMGNATIACPAGTVLIGGGFSSTAPMPVYFNGPLGATTWEVWATNHNALEQTLSAHAMCYNGAGSSSSYVHQLLPGNQSGFADCPSGDLAAGGGYQVDPGFNATSSAPTEDQDGNVLNGWGVVTYGAQQDVYAICTKF